MEPDTRTRLIDAAIRLFADRGYHATSIRTIAAHAGVNLGAVSYHFGGKRQLYRAALRTAVEAILQPPETATPRPLAERLAELLDGGEPGVRLLLHDLADGGEIALESLAPHLRRALERLDPNADAPHAARLTLARLLAPLAGAALLWPILKPALALDPQSRRRLLESLLPHPTPPPTPRPRD